MNQSLNIWWLLPLATLVCGIGLAVVSQQPLNTMQELEQKTSAHTVEQQTAPLSVTQVALPPAPAPYQPKLIAKLDNEHVVVEKTHTAKERALKPQSTVDNTNAELTTAQSKLAQQFSQVMQDMANEKEEPLQGAKLHAQALTLYPQWYQNLVPPLEFSSHIYSSDTNERWVRVNEQVVKEGELIDSNMRLVRVEPQEVVIEMQQRQFTLPALSSW
ncbi:MAG: general secretion pathway protein GspB [Psychrobium sp.]